MSFESWSEFLAMGGHGLYVWLAYGASVLVVFANVVSVRRAWRRTVRESRALNQRLATAAGGTAGAARDQNPDDLRPGNPAEAGFEERK